MNRGKLIVFEGIDGCGKSTQLQRIVEVLGARGHDLVVTREPTQGPVGQKIRAMAQSGEHVAPETELAWFMEDREAHVRDLINPALERGRIVVSDRYYLSTVAYQGARGLDAEAILRESERRFPSPDLALLFEVPVEVGLARIAARGGVAEPVFEERKFQIEVARVFASLDRPYIARVDATADPETISRAVLEHIDALGL